MRDYKQAVQLSGRGDWVRYICRPEEASALDEIVRDESGGAELRGEVADGLFALNGQYTLHNLHETIETWGKRVKNHARSRGVRRIARVVYDGLWGRRAEAQTVLRERLDHLGVDVEYPMVFTITAAEEKEIGRLLDKYWPRDEAVILIRRAIDSLSGIYTDTELDMDIEFWGERTEEIANPTWMCEIAWVPYMRLWDKRNTVFRELIADLARGGTGDYHAHLSA